MIQIIADTTSSIPVQVAKEKNIVYLPQIINFGLESYRDDCEIDSATFLARFRSSAQLPKTAAPPPALYLPFYESIRARGDSAVVIAPSSSVSGTFRSATVAAEEFPDLPLRIIDTRTIAGGLGSIVLQAVRWANEGMDLDTLENKIRDLASRDRIYFVVDTLEYLYKGGRIGGAQALVGSLLQVKPILTVKNGQAEPVETQRTRRRALRRVIEIVEKESPRGPISRLSVMHSDAETDARDLAAELGGVLGVTDIPIYDLPPAIVTYAGPRALAASFFLKGNF